MVMDRNNRSHKPKGTPDGGQYETKNGSAGSDDVMPPMDADPSARIIGAHEPLTRDDRKFMPRASALGSKAGTHRALTEGGGSR